MLHYSNFYLHLYLISVLIFLPSNICITIWQDTEGKVLRNQLRTLMDVAALNSRVVMEMKPAPLLLGTKDGAKASDKPKEVLSNNLLLLLLLIFSLWIFFVIYSHSHSHSHSHIHTNNHTHTRTRTYTRCWPPMVTPLNSACTDSSDPA